MRSRRPLAGPVCSARGRWRCSTLADPIRDCLGLNTGAVPVADRSNCRKPKPRNYWRNAPTLAIGMKPLFWRPLTTSPLKITKVRCLFSIMKFFFSFFQFFLKPTEKTSLLSRLFRRRSPSKKRTTLSSFNAQFPPPEWLDSANGKVLHLHSVAVQTQAADIAASAETPAEVKILLEKFCAKK